MRLFTGDIKRDQLIICLIFAVSCAIYLIVVTVFNIETEVAKYRFEDAQKVFNGEPLSTEYPPLMLLFSLVPRVFASSEFWYNVGFVVEMFIFFVIGLIITCKLAQRLGKDPKMYMLSYTVMIALLFEFAVDRLDLIPVVFTMAAIYCFVTKRYMWAFVLLSIGTMIKLYPAVLFFVFLIPLIMKKDWKEVMKGTGAFAVAALAVMVPVIIFQPDMLSGFISFHMDRPLQLETVASGFILLFSMSGLTETTAAFDPKFLSDGLLGAWPEAVAPVLLPLTIILLVVAYIFYVFILSKSKEDVKKDDEIGGNGDSVLFANVALLSVMLFLTFGKVFSSQYLMWLIPVILLVFMLSSDAEWKRKVTIMFVAIVVLAQLQFAYTSGYRGGAMNITDLGESMIIAKAILMIILLYLVIRPIYDRYRSQYPL
ncbi:MAG: glycosyltransferase 87 family protein [Methanomassiliicoccaceae archaeon]|jgi:uncharacterized membrane protein|nr:glycosyltransferase 87 family protein [Methanomassiliicoccaceae archaeon]